MIPAFTTYEHQYINSQAKRFIAAFLALLKFYKKISARPFSIAEKSLSDSKAKYTKPHIRSCIVNQSYCTKTVAISLCEEEVFLNECCYFKFDFNDIQRDENSSFILEVDLMFADYALYSELVVLFYFYHI